MTWLLNIKQTKNDGWVHDWDHYTGPLCAIRHKEFWEDIMLSFHNTYSTYQAIESGDRDAVKQELKKHIDQAVKAFKDELMEDYDNFVKIHPLIKKGD